MNRRHLRGLISRIPAYILLSVLSLAFIYPFLFTFSKSLQESSILFMSPAQLIPRNPTLANYVTLLEAEPFLRWILNSFIVASTVTIVKLLFDSMAGYAFARRRFLGKELVFSVMLGTLMVPVAVTMIPIFLIVSRFHLVNTYWALILPPIAYPLGIFLMRQYMSTLPSELEDAARIDGCTDFEIYYRIILPLSVPALAVLAIYTFMNQWISLLWPVIATTSLDMRTFTVGISVLKADTRINWGLLMAANFTSFIPIAVIFMFLQKYFIEGLTLGATKG